MTGQPAALPRHFISSAYVPCVLKPGPKLPCASCYLKIGFTIVATSWGVWQSRWTGLRHQSVARRDWHTVPLLPCYCISIITIIKVRRSKLAIQRKWHEVLGASLPILQAVPLSLKKKKCTLFFSQQTNGQYDSCLKEGIPACHTDGSVTLSGPQFPHLSSGGRGVNWMISESPFQSPNATIWRHQSTQMSSYNPKLSLKRQTTSPIHDWIFHCITLAQTSSHLCWILYK